MMSLSTILFLVSCLFLGGCSSTISNEPATGRPNTAILPSTPPTKRAVNDSIRVEKNSTSTRKGYSPNVRSKTPGQDISPVFPRVFDADDSPLPFGSPTECSGTFFDSNEQRLSRVSIAIFDIEDEESGQVPMRITLQCSYSIVSYTTALLTDNLPSCRHIQRAIAIAPLCESRESIGDKAEFVERLQHLFVMNNGIDEATNGLLASVTEGMCPMLVGQSTLAALRVPRSIPTGIDGTVYEIYFEFNSSIELFEFYQAANVADVACPIALNMVNFQETRNRLTTSMASIMNSISGA